MKDRLLNILIATFIFLLLLNFFMPKNEKKSEPTEPTLVVSKATEVVPNYPKLSLKNPSSSAITFDTCKDLVILKDARTVTLDAPYQSFCKTLTVNSGETKDIDLAPVSTLFATPGNIAFKLMLQGKEIISTVTVEDRGFFRTLLASIFYAPILNLFVGLITYLPGHSLGWAIVLITILVRLILLIPQHHMLMSARKMQEIQHKVKALQEKYKDDQAKMGMELMELYKREKVNPLGSCLPLLIQTPILIVLYWVLTSIDNTSNSFYLYGIFRNFDISSIQHVFLGMNLLEIGGWTGAILAIIVGITQFLQIWLSQKGKKPNTKAVAERDPTSLLPDPDLMNKFMLWGLPFIIAGSTYYFPHGVGMYWFIGTLFMLVQQMVVNRLTEQKKWQGELVVPESDKKTKKSKTVIEGK